MTTLTLREELETAVKVAAKDVPILNMDEVVKQVKRQGSGTAQLLNGLNVTVRRQWIAEVESLPDAVTFSMRKKMRQQITNEVLRNTQGVQDVHAPA